MSSVVDMQKRLDTMEHIPSLAEAREAVEKTVAEAPAAEPKDDPKREREYPFSIKITVGKKLFEGEFVNVVPDVATQRMIGLLRAQLSGGRPYETLDPFTRELFLMVAHLSYSLKTKPKWATDLTTLDQMVIEAIYAEVAEHEATFRGLGQAQA